MGEVITISPVSNAVFDVQGLTASSTQSNNTVNANADFDGDGITDPLDLCSGTPHKGQQLTLKVVPRVKKIQIMMVFLLQMTTALL